MIANYKVHYTNIAYQNANILEPEWLPNAGYKANAAIMDKLYIYYQQLYLKAPNKFLWLGLARLTGGQVMWGMQNLCKIAKDPCSITQHIVQIAKDIFEDLAWQHEMFLQEPQKLLEVLISEPNNKKYNPHTIWTTLFESDDASKISEVNLQQLHNEQLSTVQPHYELIRQDAYSKKYLWLTRFTMRNIHPYHNRFIVDVAIKDVTIFEYRWLWISHAKGMWASWAKLSQTERTRLVSLSNKDVMQHNW